jgi:hypothetical protein
VGLAATVRLETVTVRSLIEMLAATLGWEKSAEEVDKAVQRLGFPPVLISPTQAATLMAELSKAPGMVGVTARFARSRMELSRGPAAPPPAARRASIGPPTPPCGIPAVRPPALRAILISELVGLLADAVGQARAEETVLDAIRRLHLPARALSRTQTLIVLDDLASRSGPVAVSARFAKARAILLFGE